MSNTKVCIVGGGWAGLAAATKLINSGCDVTLYERNDKIGGRCASNWDNNFKEWLDIGTHAFLGAYKQSFELLNRWDVDYKSQIKFISGIEWRSRNGKNLILKLNTDEKLPGVSKRQALKSLAAMMSFKGMSLKDRFKTVRALESLINFREDSYKVEPTIAQYLEKFKIKPNDCGGLWEAITLAVFNGNPEAIGLFPLVNTIKEGLMVGGGAAKIGIMKTSFKQLLIDPAEDYLKAKGVDIVTRLKVNKIFYNKSDNSIGVIMGNTRRIYEKLILAVPPVALIKLLPTDIILNRFFSRFSELESAPIVTVHFKLKKSTIRRDLIRLPGSLTQWVFSRGTNQDADTSDFSAVISDAPRQEELSTMDFERAVINDIRNVFGNSIGSEIECIKTIRYPDATVQLKPGSKKLRPAPKTPINGLFLAGDWCDTDLPATIESATRSGNKAAEELLRSL